MIFDNFVHVKPTHSFSEGSLLSFRKSSLRGASSSLALTFWEVSQAARSSRNQRSRGTKKSFEYVKIADFALSLCLFTIIYSWSPHPPMTKE